MKKGEITEWVRVCPRCKENVYHKTKRTRNQGNGKICYECKRKDMVLQFTGEKNPMFNKTHTVETREKLRKLSLGKKMSQESIDKIVKKLKGMKRSNEAKRNLSLSKMGEKNPFYGKVGNEIPFYGKTHSEEVKKKLRKYCLERISLTGKFGGFNKIACKFFDVLNEKMNWNGKHALNEGEHEIIGYSLDYFNRDLNLIIEWDEPYHNKPETKQKDLIRQKNLLNELNCQFYRVDERNNKVYKVDNNNEVDHTDKIQELLNEF
jgi:NUMOD3 motif